jgi:CRP/FNR family cyclic AMP-dependent transcriptional regulator
MELVSRMMDGSLAPEGRDPGREAPWRRWFGRDDKVDRLQKVPLFDGCSRRQLRAVARITQTYHAPAGAILTRAGEPGNQFFLICRGTARVQVSSRKHGRLGPGDFFGEMSLLDGEPRSATVIAETDLTLLFINRKHFSQLLSEVPDLGRSILVALSRRLRETERALREWQG